MNLKKIGLLVFVLLMSTSVKAQPYEKSDSGWVSLFNGQNLDGLYVMTGGKLRDPTTQTVFKVSNNQIDVKGGGYLASKGVYGNYQVRIQYKFGNSNKARNAGLLYHIVAADFKEGDAYGSSPPVDRLHASWPTCIEFQMYNGNGASGVEGAGPHAGAFLGIKSVWAKSKVNRAMSCAYDENGEDYDVILGGLYCARRVGPVVREELNDYDNWVSFRLDAMGDSVAHYVNGKLVAKVWNIEFKDRSSPTRGPMVEGHIALQAEGAPVSYKNFEIRMLDSLGVPIISGCTDSTAKNFVPFATKDDGNCQIVSIQQHIKTDNNVNVSLVGENLKIEYQLADLNPNALLEVIGVNGEVYKSISLQQLKGKATWKIKSVPASFVFIKLTSGSHTTIKKQLLVGI